jgi:membrane-associated phospholipid phosphatase
MGRHRMAVSVSDARPRPAAVVAPVLALLVCAGAFAVDTDLIVGSRVPLVDRSALHEAVGHRTSAVTALMKVVTDAAEIPLLAIALLTGTALGWRRGSWRPMVLVVAAGALSVVAATAVKNLTDRTRPPSGYWAVHETDFSFPSRHTTMAAALLCVLAFLVAERAAARIAAAAVWAGALVLVALVGASRIYLGVHWATDVLGGFTLGSSTGFVLVSVDLWRRVRTGRRREAAPYGPDADAEHPSALPTARWS